MNINTETPRTDNQEYYIDGHYHVSADLSRQIERELIAFKRSNERIIADYNAVIRELKSAQLDCGNAEKRCDAAIESWCEERDRALREAARVADLRDALRVAAAALGLAESQFGIQMPLINRARDSVLAAIENSALPQNQQRKGENIGGSHGA